VSCVEWTLISRVFPWRFVRKRLLVWVAGDEVRVYVTLLISQYRNVDPLDTGGTLYSRDALPDLHGEVEKRVGVDLIDLVEMISQRNYATSRKADVAI
jgi:hypothetical protein